MSAVDERSLQNRIGSLKTLLWEYRLDDDVETVKPRIKEIVQWLKDEFNPERKKLQTTTEEHVKILCDDSFVDLLLAALPTLYDVETELEFVNIYAALDPKFILIFRPVEEVVEILKNGPKPRVVELVCKILTLYASVETKFQHEIAEQNRLRKIISVCKEEVKENPYLMFHFCKLFTNLAYHSATNKEKLREEGAVDLLLDFSLNNTGPMEWTCMALKALRNISNSGSIRSRAFDMKVPQNILQVMRKYQNFHPIQLQGIWILLNLTHTNSNVKKKLLQNHREQILDGGDEFQSSSNNGASTPDMLEILSDNLSQYSKNKEIIESAFMLLHRLSKLAINREILANKLLGTIVNVVNSLIQLGELEEKEKSFKPLYDSTNSISTEENNSEGNSRITIPQLLFLVFRVIFDFSLNTAVRPSLGRLSENIFFVLQRYPTSCDLHIIACKIIVKLCKDNNNQHTLRNSTNITYLSHAVQNFSAKGFWRVSSLLHCAIKAINGTYNHDQVEMGQFESLRELSHSDVALEFPDTENISTDLDDINGNNSADEDSELFSDSSSPNLTDLSTSVIFNNDIDSNPKLDDIELSDLKTILDNFSFSTDSPNKEPTTNDDSSTTDDTTDTEYTNFLEADFDTQNSLDLSTSTIFHTSSPAPTPTSIPNTSESSLDDMLSLLDFPLSISPESHDENSQNSSTISSSSQSSSSSSPSSSPPSSPSSSSSEKFLPLTDSVMFIRNDVQAPNFELMAHKEVSKIACENVPDNREQLQLVRVNDPEPMDKLRAPGNSNITEEIHKKEVSNVECTQIEKEKKLPPKTRKLGPWNYLSPVAFWVGAAVVLLGGIVTWRILNARHMY